MAISINFPEGQSWIMRSDIPEYQDFHSEPYIVIPIDQIKGLEDAEIGERVRRLVEAAKFSHALDFSIELIENATYYRKCPPDLIRHFVDRFLPLLEYMLSDPYPLTYVEREDEVIRAARNLLLELERRYFKRPTPKEVAYERQRIASRYDKILVQLGRRDGFCCACCGDAPPDLEIDHIIPVCIGGTSELDNLQILCAKCNNAKGDKIIDYRPKVDGNALEAGGEQ